MRSSDLVLMGVIDAILLLILIFAARRTRRRWLIRRDLRAFRAAAVQTTGRIVDNLLESRPGRTSSVLLPNVASVVTTHGDLVFWPVVTFTGPTGDNITFTARRPYRRQSLVGAAVGVSYNPADPHEAEITGETPEPRFVEIKIALVVIFSVVLVWNIVHLLLYFAGVVDPPS